MGRHGQRWLEGRSPRGWGSQRMKETGNFTDLTLKYSVSKKET